MNRGTIYVENGEIVSTEAFAGEQFVQRIRVPRCAAAAKAGSFVHITCDESLPMRRPLSIMRTQDDCIDILYKNAGVGLHLLSQRSRGDVVSVLGPIGMPFRPDPERPIAILIGGGVGIPPMVFLADTLREESVYTPLAILGSEIPFPFPMVKSKLNFDATDDDVRSTMPLLESWGIAARLTSLAGLDGCFYGVVTDLAERWLETATADDRALAKIYCCGPTPMLRSIAALAANYGIPCEVALEEFMACAVGGCAGCTVLVETPEGPAMKRVCIDGPVFDAATVVW